MLQFMGDNKRLLQFHEQKLSDLEAFKSDTQMFQKNTSASLKNLETQVGQLALNGPECASKEEVKQRKKTKATPKHCLGYRMSNGQKTVSGWPRQDGPSPRRRDSNPKEDT